MPLTDAIILAAGSSSRLGQPKQLVYHEGKSLLEGIISKIEATGLVREILVVLGANLETIEPLVKWNKSRIVLNKEWENGMGSSFKKGLENLKRKPVADRLLVTVCDLPGITTKLLIDLITQHQSGRISASVYPGGRIGTPVVFCKSQIIQLGAVPDQEGARKFLKDNPDLIDRISFELGYWDIDTPDDLSTLANG